MKTNDFDDFMARYNVSEVRYKTEQVQVDKWGINASYVYSSREQLIQITLPESSLKRLIQMDTEIEEERRILRENSMVCKAYHKYLNLFHLVRNDYK